MYICVCNALSDRSIRSLVQSDCAPRRASDVYRAHGCKPQCGKCLDDVKSMIAPTPGLKVANST